MRILWLVMGASLGGIASAAVAKQSEEIIVTAAPARIEIERVLIADNLDVDALGSRIVADSMTRIARGSAPADFWRAYLAHVAAWQRLADFEGRARIAPDDATSLETSAAALANAKRQIETTFDEVERVARRYGARLPFYR